MKARMILPGLLVLIFLTGSFTQAMAQEKKEAKVYEKVEVMPKFEGKDFDHFKNWVMKNIVYPKEALKEGVSGKVYASFVVAADGSVKDIKIKKGVNKLLDDEVLRVVKTTPKWSPGFNKGKAVDVSMVIPVEFKLS